MAVGFPSKKQYAPIAETRLIRNPEIDLCLECTKLALFFSISFISSMTYLFLSAILSHKGISLFFILLFSPVTTWMPSSKRCSKSFWEIYPLSAKSFPYFQVSVIHVSWCKTECYDFSTVIAHKVQLKTVTPSHCAFSVFGKATEHFIGIPAYIMTNGYHCAVCIRYACTPSPCHNSEKIKHLEKHSVL